jgi:hypothetical protein
MIALLQLGFANPPRRVHLYLSEVLLATTTFVDFHYRHVSHVFLLGFIYKLDLTQ